MKKLGSVQDIDVVFEELTETNTWDYMKGHDNM